MKRKQILEPSGGLSAKEENRLRIEKMKRLYGLYKQFQEEEAKQEEPLTLPEVKPSPEKPVPMKILPQTREDVVLP